MSDRPRDPFEEAAEEEFRRASPEPDRPEPPVTTATPEPFGRSATAMPGADDEDRPNDPVPVEADPVPVEVRLHTPIAAEPPDEPDIYARASEDRASAGANPFRTPSRANDDPTGERFRSGAFSNEPGWLTPGPKNAQLCYWMNLAGFVIWPLPLVSVALAVTNRPKVGPELGSHYTYAMRTIFLVVLYGLLASVMGRAGGAAFLAVVVWFIYRNLRGLARVGAGGPIPNPRAWLG